VPIAQRIDIAGATRLALQVWVYEAEIGAGSITLLAANDGYSPENPDSSILQTKTFKGEPIAEYVIDSIATFPLYQTVTIPAEAIGRCLAVILEVKGGPEGGPRFSLALDLLASGLSDSERLVDLVEPIITRPEKEENTSSPAAERLATAARDALSTRRPRRYPRWREIVAVGDL
jgi:hypothetical protein